jgi:hypothetical protein
MIKIDLHPDEFVTLYDLLSLQQLQSGEQILQSLRSKMKETLLQALKEKDDVQFERWEREQKEKMAKLK